MSDNTATQQQMQDDLGFLQKYVEFMIKHDGKTVKTDTSEGGLYVILECEEDRLEMPFKFVATSAITYRMMANIDPEYNEMATEFERLFKEMNETREAMSDVSE